MLKFLRLGTATIAAVLSTQINGNFPETQANAANQLVQASTSKLVMTDEALNGINNAKSSILIADSSTNILEKAEKVGPSGMILGIAALGGGAVGAILSARKVKDYFKSRSTRPSSSSRLSSSSQESTIHIDQANRGLQKELLSLLHDERDTANRLLSQVKINNPNRSINWCVEKVIFDLERDRGSY